MWTLGSLTILKHFLNQDTCYMDSSIWKNRNRGKSVGKATWRIYVQLKDFSQRWHKLPKESYRLYIRVDSHWSLEPVLSWFGTGRQREKKIRKPPNIPSKTCVLCTQQKSLGQEMPAVSGLSESMVLMALWQNRLWWLVLTLVPL